jgi:hypothetical protein
MKKAYFAHPMRTYFTIKEREILEKLYPLGFECLS